MNNEIVEIIKEISFCKFINDYQNNKLSYSHNCYEIINFQKENKIKFFQIPEPFSGEIDKAKILVISSNPSIDTSENEEYPTYEQSENEIIDFFYNRFKKNVSDGIKWLGRDGYYHPKSGVGFWKGIKGRVKEIYEILNKVPVPGVDYCLTEIVHCKSFDEIGVANALKSCSSYFNKILELSPAPLLLIVGKHAENIFLNQYDLNNIYQKIYGPELKVSGPVMIGSMERLLYIIPHPASFGPKKISQHLKSPELSDWVKKHI
jgi:uracil-DNA glycosylase